MKRTYYPNTKSLASFFDDDDPTPTEEQTRILGAAANGGDLVVQAHPGSGKTATARMLGKALDKPGYFLVFNRDARRDAQHRMGGNIKVVTGHSLAYGQIIKDRPSYERKLQWTHDHGDGGIPPPVIAKALEVEKIGIAGLTRAKLGVAVSLTIKAFQISDATTLGPECIPDKAVPAAIKLANDEAQLHSFRELVVQCSRQIWQRMANEYDRFPITHDGYVKLFHLKEVQLSSKLWLLDEYQDTTPVQDAIIRNQEGQKIYIGDPYQQIYAWRGAIDAMRRPVQAGAQRLYLSQSFRFNQTIADVANVLLSAQGEQVLMSGKEEPFAHPNLNIHLTILVRNNLSMLGVIAEYLLRRQSVYIPGGLQPEALIKAQSALSLYKGNLEGVKIRGMRELGSWQALRELAIQQDTINPEYRDLVNLIERYHGDLPRVFEWAQRPWEAMADDRGRVTLITAHRAKGREWGFVRLHDDLALNGAIIEKLRNGAPLSLPEQESVNLLYVAITRAKKGLMLPRAIKKNLGDLNALSGSLKAVEVVDSDQEAKNQARVLQRTREFIQKYGKGKQTT